MTPSGIEPATFRFVAQHLNHCATPVPCFTTCPIYIHTRARARVCVCVCVCVVCPFNSWPPKSTEWYCTRIPIETNACYIWELESSRIQHRVAGSLFPDLRNHWKLDAPAWYGNSQPLVFCPSLELFFFRCLYHKSLSAVIMQTFFCSTSQKPRYIFSLPDYMQTG